MLIYYLHFHRNEERPNANVLLGLYFFPEYGGGMFFLLFGL
jgi:hypothetical protein